MGKFCSNCGKELESTDNACSNCGTLVNHSIQPNYQNNMNYNNQMMMPQPMINPQNMYYQNMAFPNNMNYENYNIQYPMKKNNGAAIASMVLGIIAMLWAFLSLIALGEVSEETFWIYSTSEFIGYIIGFNLLSLPTSIVGFVLALTSRKKIKNGFNTSGLILCSICLVICAFIIIYFITLR